MAATSSKANGDIPTLIRQQAEHIHGGPLHRLPVFPEGRLLSVGVGWRLEEG